MKKFWSSKGKRNIKHKPVDRTTLKKSVKPVVSTRSGIAIEPAEIIEPVEPVVLTKPFEFGLSVNRNPRTKNRRGARKKSIVKTILKKISLSDERKKIATVAIAAFIVFGATGFFLLRVSSAAAVNSIVTIEAGDPMPDASIFARSTEDRAEYITDVSGILLNKVEDIDLSVSVNEIAYDVILRVVDTIAPTATPIPRLIAVGETLFANDFVIDVYDATEVSVTYKEPPDYSTLGKQEVTVILEDEGGNVTELLSCVYIFDISSDGIIIEAGTDISNIPMYKFLIEVEGLCGMYESAPITFERDISQWQANTVGVYEVSVLLSKTVYSSHISVVDTSPPTGQAKDVSLWVGQKAEPLDFVQDAHDYSEFTARFMTEPDFDLEDVQLVTVILEDVWNNVSEIVSTLTIKRSTTPPEIRGTKNLTVFVGARVLYREGVIAWSDAYGEIDFDVDSSEVNINVVGSYPVKYTAVDLSGNRTEVTITVSVTVYTPASVNELADAVLAGIINSSMGQTEKARAIHRWIRNNIVFGASTERDRLRAARNGLQNRIGDCYTFYAVSSIMLERAGINNVMIRRIPGIRSTNHFWNLIQIGGVWYHFDATPSRFGFNGFMFTSEEAARVSALQGDSFNFFTYDPSLYPQLAGATAGTPSQSDNSDDSDDTGETDDDSGETGDDTGGEIDGDTSGEAGGDE
ncbi:MAG: hypothetical protein FWE83_03465 [Oscillospiraceae bacterium]|nr:hypothetical protein [Oscillospiraceae bacterium]